MLTPSQTSVEYRYAKQVGQDCLYNIVILSNVSELDTLLPTLANKPMVETAHVYSHSP